MSHFVVMIIGHENLDKALEPFWSLDLSQDEIARDPRAEFHPKVTTEEAPAYIRDHILKFLDVEANLTDKEIKEKRGSVKPDAHRALYRGRADGTLIQLENNDLAAILNAWGGWVFNEEADAYGRYRNPNARWDWWQLGGRWIGTLRLKEGTDGMVGEPGLMTDPSKEGCVDMARYGDIDWLKMVNPVRGDWAAKFWGLKVDKSPEDLTDDEKAWFKSEARVAALYDREYYLDQFGTRERFVNSRAYEYITWAVITPDGKWHQPGQMAGFGTHNATGEERQKWIDTFWETFLKDLEPDTIIAFVDCHAAL